MVSGYCTVILKINYILKTNNEKLLYNQLVILNEIYSLYIYI